MLNVNNSSCHREIETIYEVIYTEHNILCYVTFNYIIVSFPSSKCKIILNECEIVIAMEFNLKEDPF